MFFVESFYNVYHNYHCCEAILMGLQSDSVHRLTDAWKVTFWILFLLYNFFSAHNEGVHRTPLKFWYGKKTPLFYCQKKKKVPKSQFSFRGKKQLLKGGKYLNKKMWKKKGVKTCHAENKTQKYMSKIGPFVMIN